MTAHQVGGREDRGGGTTAPTPMSRALEELSQRIVGPVARRAGSSEEVDALGQCHDDVRALFRFAVNLDELVGATPVRWCSLRDAVDDRRRYADRFGVEVCAVGRDEWGYHLLVATATGTVTRWHHDDDGPLLERAASLSELLGEVVAAVDAGQSGAPIVHDRTPPAPRTPASGAHVTGPFRLRSYVRTNDVSYNAAVVAGQHVLRRLTFGLEARSLVDGSLMWHRAAGRGRESVAWAIPTADGIVASVGRSEVWHLIALDASGDERWRHALPSSGSGAVLNGALWVLAGCGATATLRKYEATGAIAFELEVPNGGMLQAEPDGLVYAADTQATDGLYRFDPSDTSVRRLLPGRLSHLDTDGTYRLLSYFGQDDYVVTDRSGEIRFRCQSRSIPVMHRGRLYFIERRGRARWPTCLDLASGAPRWVREPEIDWSPSEMCPLGPAVAIDAHPTIRFLDSDTGETVGALTQPPDDDECTLSLSPQSYRSGVAALELGQSLYLLELDPDASGTSRPR